MISKEEKAKMLLDVYECEKSRLAKEYKAKSDELENSKLDPDNLSQKTIELNNWYETESDRIEKRFIRAILQMEAKC